MYIVCIYIYIYYTYFSFLFLQLILSLIRHLYNQTNLPEPNVSQSHKETQQIAKPLQNPPRLDHIHIFIYINILQHIQHYYY